MTTSGNNCVHLAAGGRNGNRHLVRRKNGLSVKEKAELSAETDRTAKAGRAEIITHFASPAAEFYNLSGEPSVFVRSGCGKIYRNVATAIVSTVSDASAANCIFLFPTDSQGS
jgi:hypothetical protein